MCYSLNCRARTHKKKKALKEVQVSTGPLRRSGRLQSMNIPNMTEDGDEMDASLGGDDFLREDGEYDPSQDASEEDDEIGEQSVLEEHMNSQKVRRLYLITCCLLIEC